MTGECNLLYHNNAEWSYTIVPRFICIWLYSDLVLLKKCVTQIKNWMFVYKPQSDSGSTICLLFDIKDELKSTLVNNVGVWSDSVPFSLKAITLWIYIDYLLPMKSNISNPCHKHFSNYTGLATWHLFLECALILHRLNYCDILLLNVYN